MVISWELSLLLFSILSLFSIYLLHLSSHKKLPKKTPYYPPGLHPHPIIGHLPQFLRNRHRFLDWLTELLAASPTNTVIFHRPGNIRGIITANPANVEHMLKSHFDNYPKGDRFRSNLHDFLGRGIFNSDGSLWRLQRNTASSEFKTRSFRSFVYRTVAHEISARLIPTLREASENNRTIDFQDTLERFAFDNICKVAFDVDASGLDSVFATAFRDAEEISAGRFRYAVPEFWRVKKVFDVGSERRLRKCIAIVHEFAMKIIRERKNGVSGGDGEDLLSRFIGDEENNSDEFLRDIIISFILAGRETTSSALTWFFWLISSRPAVERRIRDEVAAVRAATTRFRKPMSVSQIPKEHSCPKQTPGLEELRRMHYLHAALTEAMRLYPPVPFNSAVCCADEVLPDGTEIKKGSFMSYNAYAMGRMEGIWGEDCREFRPERWLEVAGGEFRAESPFRFPAFHGGPRMCLGKEMAYIQMKLIAVCVIERFEREVMVDRDTCPKHLISLTLRMRGGLPVRVCERRAAAIGTCGDCVCFS